MNFARVFDEPEPFLVFYERLDHKLSHERASKVAQQPNADDAAAVEARQHIVTMANQYFYVRTRRLANGAHSEIPAASRRSTRTPALEACRTTRQQRRSSTNTSRSTHTAEASPRRRLRLEAVDAGSGGCGFDSRRGCYFVIFRTRNSTCCFRLSVIRRHPRSSTESAINPSDRREKSHHKRHRRETQTLTRPHRRNPRTP